MPPDADFPDIAQQLAERIGTLPASGGRTLIAIAGAPAGGKSSLAGTLVETLQETGLKAQVVPMDGFHLDNRVLEARGLLARKGAPETFDAEGFIALIHRIREGGEVVYPVFDRGRDIAIAGAGVIGSDCKIVIVEGNYLLFDEAPWRFLTRLWDLSVWIETPEQVLRDRCIARWLQHGHTPEQARLRAEGNDMKNAQRILAARQPADFLIGEIFEAEI